MPSRLDIHCIVDNYATHSHPKVKAWLAAPTRWHMHFIPTYSSWLNQVERFFGLITEVIPLLYYGLLAAKGLARPA